VFFVFNVLILPDNIKLTTDTNSFKNLLKSHLLPAGSAAGSSAGIVFTHDPIFGFFAT